LGEGRLGGCGVSYCEVSGKKKRFVAVASAGNIKCGLKQDTSGEKDGVVTVPRLPPLRHTPKSWRSPPPLKTKISPSPAA